MRLMWPLSSIPFLLPLPCHCTFLFLTRTFHGTTAILCSSHCLNAICSGTPRSSPQTLIWLSTGLRQSSIAPSSALPSLPTP
ncbi:hypothetical protein SEVIR_9G046150v4 [Setaria viridis]